VKMQGNNANRSGINPRVYHNRLAQGCGHRLLPGYTKQPSGCIQNSALRHGHREVKDRSMPHLAGHTDFAAMGFDDRLGNC